MARVSANFFSHVIPGLNTYLFRRTHNELEKNHLMGPTSFPAMLGPWVDSGYVEIVKNEIRFRNGPGRSFVGGSRIFLCHCQHEKDVFKWLGPEIHYLILEQGEQFTEFMIRMLRGRNRIPDALHIPEQYKKLFPRCLYTFNPGGPGHVFFKTKFVKARAPMSIETVSDDEGGKRRQFIPAKLEDNPSVDPKEYEKTLSGLPPKMRKALRDGDFDTVIGAFFPEVDRSRHILKPFTIPDYWTRGCGLDWGACGEGDPFSLGWCAISDGSVEYRDSERHFMIPRGAMVIYRRWNGAGLPKVTASAIADGILKRERFGLENAEKIEWRTAGGDILEKKGHGESIYDILYKHGVLFTRADMRRQSGHAQFRERLVGLEDGRPMIYWFEDCDDDIESISSLQHDISDNNDTAPGDDHDYDRVRYLCMSRPWVKNAVIASAPPVKQGKVTIGAYVKSVRANTGRPRV
jgi:hypothetical protein